MRTVKIILSAVLAISLVASCKDPNFVSRQDYDALMKEYEDLQAGSAAIREEYAQQAKSVDNILEKLSQISGSTVVLRSDMERGTAQMTQVQQIENGLDNIKDQLDELEKATKSNRQLRLISPADFCTKNFSNQGKCSSPASTGYAPPAIKSAHNVAASQLLANRIIKDTQEKATI